ncbi:MAG: hypothetical protein ACAF41_21290 [Leptolyngbya sp. BL-A-14]
MQLADCSSTSHPVRNRVTQDFSGPNQKAYLRLKVALSLNLRRQIFLAVCDDVALRNRLAARLYAELGYPSPKLAAVETTEVIPFSPSSAVSLREKQSVIAPKGNLASVASSGTLPPPLLYPRLVSLNLNLSDPNPMVQIAEWLAQYPPPKGTTPRVRSPGFQILGTERLTRQSASVQKRFLNSLQQIEHYLSCLESPLLLWLPRPWLNAVQQSAPNFWNWHTALFEFEGDPTPVSPVNVRLHPHSIDEASPSNHGITQSRVPVESHQDVTATPLSLSEPPVVDADLHDRATTVPAESTATAESSEAVVAEQPRAGDSIAPTVTASTQSDVPAPKALASQKEDLWAILTHDLALLNRSEQTVSLPTEPVDAAVEPEPTEHIATAANAVSPANVDSAPIETDKDTPHLSASRHPDQLSASNAVAVDATVSMPVESAALTPPAPPTADRSSQSQAALDLADLILSVVAEEDGETPSSENARIIQALQQIEQLHLQQAPNATLLAAYQNLGNLCRDRIEQGYASSRHLLLTICVYEQTLQWLDDASLLWSDLLNDIGNLYWMLARHESSVDESLIFLEQAIAAYRHALDKTNPETRPHNYAMIQNNLGSAYGDMARFRAPAESLEQSVAAYETALRYRRLHDDPARYAATQNNLGTAYWNLAQHQQPVRRLKQSIASYFEALRYYSPDCEPMHYAMIQNNLGTAYWNLAQQPHSNLGVGTATGKDLSPADLLQRAIVAYRAALVYRTLAVAPAAYAATQNNLGTAHWQLAGLLEHEPQQRQEQLQLAVAAYREAIVSVDSLSRTNAIPTHPLSFDPAATHNNLGLAYHQLATDKHSRESSTQRSTYLEAALHHHLQALQAWEAQPELYQTVFSYVLQTMRAFHTEFGTKGQTQALSQIPAKLLPEVLKQL